MLPGDIDLTENLDFRKTVRKKVPKLPDNWNAKKPLNFNISDYNLSSTTSYERRISDNNCYILNYNNDYQFNITHTLSSYAINYYNINNSSTSYRFINDYTISCEDETDVFGNKIKQCTIIPDIPWDVLSKSNFKKLIPWDNILFNNLDYDDDNIAWGSEEYDIKVSNSIPWNTSKNDDTDLKYLNDMQWLRITDTIIE